MNFDMPMEFMQYCIVEDFQDEYNILGGLADLFSP